MQALEVVELSFVQNIAKGIRNLPTYNALDLNVREGLKQFVNSLCTGSVPSTYGEFKARLEAVLDPSPDQARALAP
jgi:hypothetical protein